MTTVFPYPGGKSRYAKWIISHLPNHEVYVEAFGGSGAVLAAKDHSQKEVFNDIDGDVTHFFKMLRDHSDELINWLELTPYSRELHKKYAEEFYNGHRPDDDVERAGRFYYLRCTQWGGTYDSEAIFKFKVDNDGRRGEAKGYQRKLKQLRDFASRFQGVTIECLDYVDLIKKYDREWTLWYFDPPYLDVGDGYYNHSGEFDHEKFVATLRDLEGKWLTSYTNLPDGLSDYYVVERETEHQLNHGYGDKGKDVERLVMNFNPEQTKMHKAQGQHGLESFTD